MPPPPIPTLDLSPIVAKQKAIHYNDTHTPIPAPLSHKTPSSPSASTLRKIDFGYLKGDLLGRGAFGSVHVCINNASGEIIACKEFLPPREDATKGNSALRVFQKEIAIVSKLRHPHVVGYLGMDVGVGEGGGSFRIFMEYCPAGSLRSLLKDFGPMKMGIVANYTRQLLLGLSFLHHCGVAHRDVKGANVLLSEDTMKVSKSSGQHGVTLKLADFGSARDLYDSEAAAGGHTPRQAIGPGTPLWSAPEVIRNEAKTSLCWQRADIWSLGCTVIEMITGKPPFVDQFENTHQALLNIATPSTVLELPAGLAQNAKDFLSTCMDRDATARLPPSKILNHPFVAREPQPPKSSRSATSNGSGDSPKDCAVAAPGSGGRGNSGKDNTKNSNSRGINIPPSPFGTPPLHMRKKAPLRSSPQPSTYSSFSSSQQSQSSSQWSSSRRTPPVSPGAHVGVSAPTNNPKSHNFLKPLNSSRFGKDASLADACSAETPFDPRSRQPTPPTSLINVLDSLCLDHSVEEAWGADSSVAESKSDRKKKKKKKKGKDYEEERKLARKQRRERRGRKGSADSPSVPSISSPSSSGALSATFSPSTDISISPSVKVPPPRLQGGFAQRLRSQSQSPTLQIYPSNADEGELNEVAFLSQQLNFMERLKSGNTSSQATSPTLSRASMSPTQDTTLSLNIESPRIKSFRQRFPSATKREFDGGVMEDDFVADGPTEEPIKPVDLSKKLDESIIAGGATEEEIPAQAAFIARMWLAGARQAMEFQKGQAAYNQDANAHEDIREEAGAVDDFGDIYNYENDWVEHYDFEQEWKEYEESGVWHDYRVEGEVGDVGEVREGGEGGLGRENGEGGGDWEAGEGGVKEWDGIELAGEHDGNNDAVGDINDGWDDGNSLGSGSAGADVPPAPLIVKAISAFESTDETELGFLPNELIAVTNEDQSGWWYGFTLESGEVDLENIKTRSGWFPKTFVEEAT